MVLGKLPVPGRPANLDYGGAIGYCACSRWGWEFGRFSLSYRFSLLSPSLWEMARYRLKHCLKGPLSPSQPANQPSNLFIVSYWIFCCQVQYRTPKNHQLSKLLVFFFLNLVNRKLFFLDNEL